ncbi:MAG: molybdenum cofactor biosynthesis protein MoaAD [Puniceicoccaceae bacterium]|nr:MAG: molybdenum cofactor biosynthesis protein MoaAD [Puniceicoccaceae bacterium]
MTTPIHGLVLVGGKSQRMGRDKAMLTYHGGQTQLEHTAALLQRVCPKVFISQRSEQSFPAPEGTEPIHDAYQTIQGPLCGILSAMQADPEAHWLVLACDLPYLTESALKKLIAAFQQAPPQLTAYRSSHDGLPEPLCAIYPAGSDSELLALSRELNKNCPRKLLIVKEAALIEQDDPRSLDNINTAEEYEQTRNMQIKVLYFAQLADLAGKTEEVQSIQDASAEKLYEALKKTYHFPHEFTQIQVAINHQLSAHQTGLKDGDSIAFLPPMTGG